MKDTENRPQPRKRRKWGSVIVRKDADGNPTSFQARYVNPLDPSKKVGRNFGLEYETEAYRWLDEEHYLVTLHNKGIRQWVHPSQRGTDTMPTFREYAKDYFDKYRKPTAASSPDDPTGATRSCCAGSTRRSETSARPHHQTDGRRMVYDSQGRADGMDVRAGRANTQTNHARRRDRAERRDAAAHPGEPMPVPASSNRNPNDVTSRLSPPTRSKGWQTGSPTTTGSPSGSPSWSADYASARYAHCNSGTSTWRTCNSTSATPSNRGPDDRGANTNYASPRPKAAKGSCRSPNRSPHSSRTTSAGSARTANPTPCCSTRPC